MSIKTDAVVIRDETTTGANTATRVGTNLVDIADDLVAKQAAIDLNSAKETNIDHPLVETAVPVGAVFTDNDTIYDDTAIQAEVDLNTAKVGITAQQASDITTNNAKVGVTVEEANPDVVSQVDAEAGIATDERIWTAQRVKQAIDALAGGGAGVDDTAYGISWDGVTGIAPSKNALYDFIQSQVFKVDASSNIIPIFWGGTQAEYDIDFPSGHTNEYFIVITDGAVSPTNASDIVNAPSGNLVATDVQAALDELQTELDANISFDSVSSTRLANTSGTNTGDNAVNTLYSGLVSATTANVKAINDRVLEPDLTGLATYAIDYSLAETFFLAITQATSLTELNLPSSLTSKVITIHVSGNFALTYPAGWDTNITGAYTAGTGLTTITVEYVATAVPFYKVLIVQ